MKIMLKNSFLAGLIFALGFGCANFAISSVPSRIAVVDVQQLVTNASSVKALKAEQEKQMKDLKTFVEKAKKEVEATTDKNKKQALEDKYNKELRARKQQIDKNFTQKLEAIDKNISATISKEAKAKNYEIVLAKGLVLYGGEDITAELSKIIK